MLKQVKSVFNQQIQTPTVSEVLDSISIYTDDKSCDSDEQSEYNRILDQETCESNKFIVDDTLQHIFIVTLSKQLSQDQLSNIPFIREFYQKVYTDSIEEDDRESFEDVFMNYFGFSLFDCEDDESEDVESEHDFEVISTSDDTQDYSVYSDDLMDDNEDTYYSINDYEML